MNISVKNKLFTIFVIVITISVSTIGWFGFKSAKDSYTKSALSVNKSEIKAISNEIKGVLGTITQDVIYNANFYALDNLLIWEDLKDNRKIQYWKNVYMSALKDYILNKKLYYQARILDINGNEKVLLKYNEKTNSIVQTSQVDLQNKSHRNYFKEALKLKKGEFYISEMTLNVEHGMIEKPYVPVVRYSSPVIDANGEIKGVIVLNLNAKYILNKINIAKSSNNLKSSQKYYLLNKDGYYLYDEDKNKRWSFQLGSDYNFKKDNHGIFKKFKDKDEITFVENNKIFSAYKIFPDKKNNDYRYWYLVSEIDEDIALSSLDTFINIFILILLVVMVSGLLLINNYISRIINPLSKVTLQLKALANGEIKKEYIAYDANDEVGNIVRSTAKVINSIEATIKQANAVANGKFSQEFELLGKNDELGSALMDMTKRLKEISALATNLSIGKYDDSEVIIKSSEDELGLALKRMVEYLEEVTKVTESIAVGELNVKYNAKGEHDRLGQAILQMIGYLRTILNQADAIASEDFSTNLKAVSQNDELGLALVAMTDILRTTSAKNKKEIFLSDGVSNFSNTLNGITDTVELSKVAISTVCRYIGASSGVVYNFENEEKSLKMIASFAYVSRNSLSNEFKIGEGIVGQVALEKEPILLKNIRDDEFEVQSGTTLTRPKEVYAFTLINDNELYGVMEIMSFESFTDINIEYLQKVAEIFSSTLHTTMQNAQIKELLDKSQAAFEELQVKSEELQESNVQMEEQQQQLEIQSRELKEQNNDLALAKQEIDIRADELEKASKYKSEFLANMSHELRTPLNSIILLSKLLTQNLDGKLGEKDVEKSAVIHKAGNDLLLLINDILDLSKIESGNMELIYEDVASSEIINDVNGLFGALANEKNLEFRINDKFNNVFSTDKVKLSQVLKNLLSNAFKFTKDGFVEIIFEQVNDRLHIVVKDSGIGVPQDKLETIFEAFKQVDGSISREFGGTGLGLSITKTIIDLMDGTINVESVEGEGASFTITLPLDKAISKTSIKKVEVKKDILKVLENEAEIVDIISQNDDFEHDSNELHGKNILIVDDDSRNIFTLTSVLESMDAEVYSAFNGKDALELLNEETEEIDLILMDIMMPVMDGLKAMEIIKANDKFKHIPIIAITAKTMPEDKQQCLDSGANDYLAKPLEHNALISMIKAWIK